MTVSSSSKEQRSTYREVIRKQQLQENSTRCLTLTYLAENMSQHDVLICINYKTCYSLSLLSDNILFTKIFTYVYHHSVKPKLAHLHFNHIQSIGETFQIPKLSRFYVKHMLRDILNHFRQWKKTSLFCSNNYKDRTVT